MTDLVKMKAEVERLRRELNQAVDAYFAAQQEASTIKIGDIFRRTAHRGFRPNHKEIEERARVIGFSRTYSGELVPRLRMLKKDGADGLRTRAMLNYENWQPIP